MSLSERRLGRTTLPHGLCRTQGLRLVAPLHLYSGVHRRPIGDAGKGGRDGRGG